MNCINILLLQMYKGTHWAVFQVAAINNYEVIHLEEIKEIANLCIWQGDFFKQPKHIIWLYHQLKMAQIGIIKVLIILS